MLSARFDRLSTHAQLTGAEDAAERAYRFGAAHGYQLGAEHGYRLAGSGTDDAIDADDEPDPDPLGTSTTSSTDDLVQVIQVSKREYTAGHAQESAEWRFW